MQSEVLSDPSIAPLSINIGMHCIQYLIVANTEKDYKYIAIWSCPGGLI